MLFDRDAFNAALATEHIGRHFVYLESTPTTMEDARRAAGSGAAHGTLVLAEEQTAGRGRRGRSFQSPPGENLYFTLILRLPPETVPAVPIAVPLAVVEPIRQLGLEALIKWPNDIWVGERKVCGMLVDAESNAEGAVVFPGIGINVNGDPTANPELADIATSIRNELGKPVDREPLLAAICSELERLLREPVERLLPAYEQRSLVLGRRVTVSEPGGQHFSGTALRLDTTGSLVVAMDSGEERLVHAADVSVRPARLSDS